MSETTTLSAGDRHVSLRAVSSVFVGRRLTATYHYRPPRTATWVAVGLQGRELRFCSPVMALGSWMARRNRRWPDRSHRIVPTETPHRGWGFGRAGDESCHHVRKHVAAYGDVGGDGVSRLEVLLQVVEQARVRWRPTETGSGLRAR